MHIEEFIKERRASTSNRVRRGVGAALIAAVFVVVFWVMVMLSGWTAALFAFGTTAAIIAVITLGVWLLRPSQDE